MTDDEILVHKLELAITGRTVVYYDLDNPPLARGDLAQRLGAHRWWTDHRANAVTFYADGSTLREEARKGLSDWWAERIEDGMVKYVLNSK